MPHAPPAPVGLVGDTPRAGVLLKPLRLRILAEAREPASASTIASALGMPRQKVNYHVRQLARAGFLRRAGRQRKRGLVEQRYVVTARAFLLGAGVLGPMQAEPAATGDKLSVSYLLALAAQVQREAGQAWRAAHARGKRVAVLTLDTEVRFTTPEQRARFAEALTAAVTKVVAEHSSPARAGDESRSRPFRLILGCYPLARSAGPP